MKALVAHASKRGSTAEIAEAVAATLREGGIEVDCLPAGDVSDLAPYDAVVLGSAVYVKRWRGDAKHFLRKHREALSSLPFWVCGFSARMSKNGMIFDLMEADRWCSAFASPRLLFRMGE